MIFTAIQSSVQNAAEKHSDHSRSARLETAAKDRLLSTSEDDQIAAQNNISEAGDFEGDIIDVNAGDYMNIKEA